MKLLLSLCLLASCSLATARAEFPQEETEALARAEMEAALGNPKTQVGAAHRNLMELYPQATALPLQAVTLSENTSRSEVQALVLVYRQYTALTAGGRLVASISTRVNVELTTDAESGEVQSKKAQVLDEESSVELP